METKWYEFHENNSGGDWWLDANDIVALLKTGKWGLDMDSARGYLDIKRGRNDEEVLLYPFRKFLVGQFNSYEEAVQSWESATGWNVNEAGCECCGNPFDIYSGNAPTGEVKYLLNGLDMTTMLELPTSV